MTKIVVGVAEVNAKNNPNLAELAAADLEKKIAERFEEGAEVSAITSHQNDRSLSLFAVVSGDEVINEDEVEEDDDKPRKKKKGGK